MYRSRLPALPAIRSLALGLLFSLGSVGAIHCGSSGEPSESDSGDGGADATGTSTVGSGTGTGAGGLGSSSTSGSTSVGVAASSGSAATSGSSSSSSSGAGGAAPTKFVGNITTSGQVRPDFDMYWNQITPENEGKWGSVEAVRNQMNWAGLDKAHDYAKQHGIKFKQHTLVWGSQQPSWLNGLSAAEQAAEVQQWIQLFCQRYPDVELIDVVNEPPPHTTPVYMNAIGGAGASGYDWIVQSFKWAHQYCPNATLILNDYNNIEYGNDNSHFIDIVNKIKAAGAPINAIGAQAHDAYKLPTDAVQGFVNKLTATGLPLYITEYDIDLANDAQQKTVMESQFTMFWKDPNIKGITIWGYIVGATWKPNTGLMTSAGAKRPAMTWLMSFLGK
jgi:endo-1,4-beta-xylanase